MPADLPVACLAGGIVWVRDLSFGGGAAFQKKGVGTIPPATQANLPAQERLLTVGTSRKEDLERGWLFAGRLIVRLQNSLFVFLNC